AQLTVEDQAGVTFSASHGDPLTVLQQFGGIAATHYRWNAEFARDDRRVAGTSTAIGDNGAGALHHRLPIGVGHVRYQHVTRLDLVHFRNVTNDLHRTCADALPNRTPFDEHCALFLQQVALHDVGAAA